MCLITTKDSPLHTAEKDIPVWKTTVNNRYLYNLFESENHTYRYKLDELVTTEFSFIPADMPWKFSTHNNMVRVSKKYPAIGNGLGGRFGFKWQHDKKDQFICIGQGFHSVIDYSMIRSDYACQRYRRVGRFIIPKGAKFYEECHELASNQIIFKGYEMDGFPWVTQ